MMQFRKMSGLAGWLLALYAVATGCHVGTDEFCFSVVNLSYWKPGITGAALHFLFKQAITPLHHFHREKGENKPQLRFSGRDLGNW